ncbi:hypothetical protein DH2020_014025 [Rehmannia glutinosa]|uniref:Band 7 domain-containing protein n=1 Tax=Rehmannia glutinosa TaxID=99300 RepID=A0ABR0WYU5_REHGL
MGQTLGCVQVDQSTVAMKEQFGKFDNVLEPGCHCLPWCIGYQLAGSLSLRVQQLDVRCETKTKDNVFVTVVASVQYRALAEKAADAFYKLSNTKEQIQAYVFDVIRASVPKLDLDSTFEQKNDIAKAVEDELEKAMSAYGYEIVQTLIVDIEPDAQVKRAMNEINAAARLRVAATEKAEPRKSYRSREPREKPNLTYSPSPRAGTSAKDVMDMILITQDCRHDEGNWRVVKILGRVYPRTDLGPSKISLRRFARVFFRLKASATSYVLPGSGKC